MRSVCRRDRFDYAAAMRTAEYERLAADLRSGITLEQIRQHLKAAAAAGGKVLPDSEPDGIAEGGQGSTGNPGFLTGNIVIIPINISILP